MEDPILDKSKQFNLCKARLTLGALVFACINFCKAKKIHFASIYFRELLNQLNCACVYFHESLRFVTSEYIFLHLFDIK